MTTKEVLNKYKENKERGDLLIRLRAAINEVCGIHDPGPKDEEPPPAQLYDNGTLYIHYGVPFLKDTK